VAYLHDHQLGTRTRTTKSDQYEIDNVAIQQVQQGSQNRNWNRNRQVDHEIKIRRIGRNRIGSKTWI
jgi:hypothetical protein